VFSSQTDVNAGEFLRNDNIIWKTTSLDFLRRNRHAETDFFARNRNAHQEVATKTSTGPSKFNT
jgi:hypothetical protein